jgi:uncharacterized protein (UPF0297 family)
MGYGEGALLSSIVAIIMYYGITNVLKYNRLKNLKNNAKGNLKTAINLLEEKGYNLKDLKVVVSSELIIDGKKNTRGIKVDGIATKSGIEYAFIFKNSEGSRLTSLPNRRLLLELFAVMGTRGIIWVDISSGKLREISFKQSVTFEKSLNKIMGYVLAGVVGLILSYLLLKGVI